MLISCYVYSLKSVYYLRYCSDLDTTIWNAIYSHLSPSHECEISNFLILSTLFKCLLTLLPFLGSLFQFQEMWLFPSNVMKYNFLVLCLRTWVSSDFRYCGWLWMQGNCPSIKGLRFLCRELPNVYLYQEKLHAPLVTCYRLILFKLSFKLEIWSLSAFQSYFSSNLWFGCSVFYYETFSSMGSIGPD